MAALFIVATPIGNLEDITLRALSVLTSVHLILAEDTRVAKRLLDRHGIRTPVMSYHQHSGIAKIGEIIGLLHDGRDLAVISDAGTPGINDPGGKLVAEAVAAIPDLKIIPIPGPNAATAALSASGLPADRYTYLGFPPHKKGRETFFKNVAALPDTVVFYESKHRIRKALESLRDVSKTRERRIVLCRELTKQFETLYRGTIDQVISALAIDNILGEFVVVVGPERKSKAEQKASALSDAK